MIVTVTPNPSLDRTYELDTFVRGEINRAVSVHEHAGGKGINVSRALARQGVQTVAVLPVGGIGGDRLAAMLGAHGVPAVPVPISGDIRTNVTLAEASGVTTKINEVGPELSDEEVDALVDAVDDLLRRSPRYLVAAGSLPGGATGDLYARLAERARLRGVAFVLDSSGPALEAAVATGGIDLLKPNDDELAELTGRSLVTVGDVTEAAREVLARGVGRLLVSLGAHGALLVTSGAVVWAGGPALVALSTVGAGDTTLAGFLAHDDDPAARLRTAVAWGRAAVRSHGTAVPAPQDIDLDAVRVVNRPDPHLTIKEL